MRFFKHALLLAALSIMFVSCDDGDVNPLKDEPGIKDVNITQADYTLNTVHKSYYNPFFVEGSSPYYNHVYGLTLSLKLNKPSQLDIINRLTASAVSGADTIAYEFNKYQFHAMFSDTLGGFILTVDSLYIEGRDEYYPSEEYTWSIKLYDSDNNSPAAYTLTSKTNSYIYADSSSSAWYTNDAVKITFSGPSSLTTSRKVKVFFFDGQKKYLKDYPPADINTENPSVTFGDFPASAAYYRTEISEVNNGVKRTYTGRFEGLPDRL